MITYYDIQIQFPDTWQGTYRFYKTGQVFYACQDTGINADGDNCWTTQTNQYIYKSEGFVVRSYVGGVQIPVPVISPQSTMFEQLYNVYTSPPATIGPNGLPNIQPEVLTVVRASINPSSQQQVQTLPEGRRDNKTYTVLTKTQLQVPDSKTGKDSSQILLWDGYRYEIVGWKESINPLFAPMLNHYTYYMQRIDV